MRQTLMISVAALALAAGSTLALSQGGGGGGGAAGNPGGAGGGAMSRDSQSTIESAPGQKGAQERTGPSQKSTQQERTNQPGAQQRQTQSPTQQRQSDTQPGGSKQGTPGAQTGGAKQGAGGTNGTNQGTAQSGGQMSTNSVSLTTEQKTTIRNTVINTGPKVGTVNFDVRVGTVVPRSVKVAPVPRTIVEIQPAWRGYMYFVYEDEIVIVEPRTLKIVAVLEV